MSTASPLPPSALVLAGFIPDNLERLRRAVILPEEVFSGNTADSFLFRAYREYHRAYRGLLPIQYLADRLKGEVPEKVQPIAARFTELQHHFVDDDVFEWAFSTAFEGWRDDEAKQVLASGLRIMLDGDVVMDGDEASAARGYEAMRTRVSTGFSKIDRLLVGGSTPEADLARSAEHLYAAVGSAQTDDALHFPTGIDVLDEAMPHGGPALGQMWFIAGFAGTGKTTFCTSVITHQAMLHGLNVLYLTGETLMEDCQIALVARHSRMPHFGMPYGINRLQVRQGLPDDQLAVYQAAVADLTSNSGSHYGHVRFRQMPLRNDFDDVLDTLNRTEAEWPVHVLVVDSIDMVLPSTRDSRRDRLSQSIEEFASLAVAYQGGRGLIVISPYQINRESYNRALENSGRYELSALAETAMAERRATVVLSLLALPDSPGQLRAQILKNRYGPQREFPLLFEPNSAYIAAAAGVSNVSADPFA